MMINPSTEPSDWTTRLSIFPVASTQGRWTQHRPASFIKPAHVWVVWLDKVETEVIGVFLTETGAKACAYDLRDVKTEGITITQTTLGE